MEKKITGVLIDVKKGTATKTTITKSIESYYKHLDCRIIEIVNRSIGGRYYDIICDEEALLKDMPVVSAIGNDGSPMLFGNLFVVKFDGVDDVRSLVGDEADHVLENVGDLITPYGIWKALWRVDY